jgi:hypothetical protein
MDQWKMDKMWHPAIRLLGPKWMSIAAERIYAIQPVHAATSIPPATGLAIEHIA